MPFTLSDLPYKNDALEPVIDAKTMEIHHDRHHGTYVTNLNNAIKGKADLEAISIEDLCRNIEKVPQDIKGAVRNNGGGHYNHTMFWSTMTSPGKGGGKPGGALGKAIDATFGSFDTFKQQFADAGLKRFGSGWAWLISSGGKLAITSTPNQDNPLMKGLVDAPGEPILGLDVWEHAYYLKYQNKRADYIAAWWDVVNWPAVEARFAKLK